MANPNLNTNVDTNFDKWLLIEQIRSIETEQTLAYDIEEISSELSQQHNFDNRLWQRAKYLIDRYDLGLSLGHAAKLSHYANMVAFIVAILLGALGITYAITDVNIDSRTINIYWLLLVLLGFNFISMLLWIMGISLNMKNLTSGMLARLIPWLQRQGLPSHFRNKNKSGNNDDIQVKELADKAWLACHFSGSVGKWQLSKITHRLWLVYLLTGLIFLVLLLMVRQYDFVWGTTLLSDNVFVKLTDVLSAPLQALGFTTPSLEQVQDTRIGAAQVLTVEHRTRWAQFLLGALLCFGIVPRLLLWFFSVLMHRNSRRRFRLDYYLPYYIHLRQQLMPLATHGQIIDADASPPIDSETPVIIAAHHGLPENVLWVAVEPAANIHWPLPSVTAENDLGAISDRDSLTATLQQLQKNTSAMLAIAVSSARPPDRGIQRLITSLKSQTEQCWLVLLQGDDEPIATARLTAWYRLAETCGISADHVISLSTT